jgi:hypothetical protein
MEIKPHPSDTSKVILTIENRHEDSLAVDFLPGMSSGVQINEQFLDIHQRQDAYPFDVVIKRRSLGHLASSAMVSRFDGDLGIARQVLEYFEVERKTPSQLEEEQDRLKMKTSSIGETEVTGVKDAADYLGIHPNTLRKWSDDGLVRVLRLPTGARRFPVGVLVALREQMFKNVIDAEKTRNQPS